VSLSITEAEYIACCEGAKGLAWGRQFLSELQCLNINPRLWTDSEGAQNLSQTSRFLRRSRHIEHRFHYLRQQVQQQHLTIHFYPRQEEPGRYPHETHPHDDNHHLEEGQMDWEQWLRNITGDEVVEEIDSGSSEDSWSLAELAEFAQDGVRITRL